MKRNRQKAKRKVTDRVHVSGGEQMIVTLGQIVDYAKDLEDKDEAERMELMCYRIFGRQLTPEAADKIAEIPEQFKKKHTPTIKKFVTINQGDKVEKKTIIPSVANYNENVEKQDNNYSIPQIGGHEQLAITNE